MSALPSWSRTAPILLAVAALFGVGPAQAAVPAHGRAWELVTPADLEAWSPPSEPLAVDATGDRLVFETNGAQPGAEAGWLAVPNLAARGAGGWTSTPFAYPVTVPVLSILLPHPFPLGASTDLSTWIWYSPEPLLPGAPQDSWYRSPMGGPLALLGHVGQLHQLDQPSQPSTGDSAQIGMSDDAQHVVVQTASKLLPADDGRTGGAQLYEFVGATLRLVGADDGGGLLSPCGALGGVPGVPRNSVSRDGGRIFFTVPACDGVPARVYVRRDGQTTT
jgi:hypothetical protein